MPLGAGALAGVNYPLDRERVAAELGFDRVAPNAMDAVAARDTAFAYLAIAANCALDAVAPGGGDGAVEHPGVRPGLVARVVDLGLQHHAAEAQPRRGRAGAGKAAGFLARLQGLGARAQGTAARLQQGPAGRQALRVRQPGKSSTSVWRR